MHNRFLAILFLALSAACQTLCHAENWPMWRGPRQDGTSRETGLPVEWSATENIVWRLPLPGVAPSTPIVWDGKVFLTSTDRDGEDVLLLAIDATGKQLWQQPIGHGESEQMEKNNLAAASPCTDGKYVWTLTGNGTVSCHDFAGNLRWQFQIEERYGSIDMPWSIASSPVLDGQLLYLQLLHLNSSRVVAIDKASGSEVWNVERQTEIGRAHV